MDLGPAGPAVGIAFYIIAVRPGHQQHRQMVSIRDNDLAAFLPKRPRHSSRMEFEKLQFCP